MLLSAPRNVLNRVMLKRLENAKDEKLRDKQAEFRQNRSCADQIDAIPPGSSLDHEASHIRQMKRIQLTIITQLDDLDFADGIALLSHNHQQMQDKLEKFEKRAEETGIFINPIKTEKSNTRSLASLKVNNKALEVVDFFTYI
ncbi:uncharacterized protein [Mytilus edulis]|uniref:uncharacterized protein n=1 Tax=Mytilus edulis TaxID=6550 RepID=UPI0039F10FCE